MEHLLISKASTSSRLEQIRDEYTSGQFDKCLSLLNQEFQLYRTFQLCQTQESKKALWWNRDSAKEILVHKCQRMVSKSDKDGLKRSVCECHRLGHFLISIGYELGYSGKEMYEFLQGSFYF